jgi:transposase
MREIAWMLSVSTSTLSGWHQGFDDNMKPLKIPDKRGKASKVTVAMVRRVLENAKKKKRIRLKQFTTALKQEEGIYLSKKTVKEILIANDLLAPQSRKRRPKFYKSLCQKIPNSLLSLDGSEFTVWIDHVPFKFNVELGVDVNSFAHTAYSVADTETSKEVIRVLESHRQKWGVPIGVVCDSGSANLSNDIRNYIEAQGIELVPVGPGNPKGNGTDEGAFSQMKKAIGRIQVDMSSPKALAKSVLNALVSLYIHMRNRLCLHNSNVMPKEKMKVPISEEQRHVERQGLKEHKKSKAGGNEDQFKIDHLHWVIEHYGLDMEASELKRAEYSIKSYDLQTIGETEKAFLKAVNRKPGRCNLSYFFGILKNIQQQHDEEAIKQYCQQRYNYQRMLDMQREQDAEQQPVSIDHIISMLENVVTKRSRIVKELAIRRVSEWTQELMESYTYMGSLKKKLSDALGKLNHLSIEQKQEGWKLLDQFLNP